jgi:hypothetical protein
VSTKTTPIFTKKDAMRFPFSFKLLLVPIAAVLLWALSPFAAVPTTTGGVVLFINVGGTNK